MQILKLMPAGKDYLWGGTRLRKEYRKKIDLIPLAETWECSVHPDGLSIVENGKYRGQTLKDVIDKHPEFLGTKNQEMPVLIKFIDAMKDLSVQVHPYDDYARKYEGDNGKSEMWYVIDAEPGAELIFGFEHPVTKEILKEAVANGTLDKHLHKIKIQKGDVIYVPAGTVHGIGAGALIAEIQESSNVTYRVYDYNRTDKNGNKRELHFDKAVEVMNMDTVKESGEKRLVHYYPGSSREIICRSQYFETEKIEVNKACSFSVAMYAYYFNGFMQHPIMGQGFIKPINSALTTLLYGPYGFYYLEDVGIVGCLFTFGLVGVFLFLTFITKGMKTIISGYKDRSIFSDSVVLGVFMFLVFTMPTLFLFDYARNGFLMFVLLFMTPKSERN